MATYSKLIELLERGELRRAYAIASPDPALRERAIDRVRERVLADVKPDRRQWNTTTLDLPRDSMGEVVDAANMYPTDEGSKQAIVVRGCERAREADWTWLQEWFDTRQLPDNHLILSFDTRETDTEREPWARIAKTGRLVDATSPSEGEWRKAIAAEFPGRVLDSGVSALMARCSTLGAALVALGKTRYVAGHVDDRTVSVLVPAAPEVDAVDALLGEDPARAAQAGRHASAEEVSRCIGLVERRLRDAEALREAQRASVNLTEAAKRAGVPIFRAKEIADAAKHADANTLARRRIALAKADVMLHEGSAEVAWLYLCAGW